MESHLGPYQLIQPLGSGGMAETFLAVRRGPGDFTQHVCLKRILPGRSVDPNFIELFRDEARLLAHLRYAGIVQVYDFGEARGTYYMALELVDGVDLDKLIALLRGANLKLPVSLALYIVSEVLAALHYAHTLHIDGEPLSIVHRDISPANVLLSRHGEVKLTDFGIAKFRSRKHRTQSGHVKGKIAYMSPEQVQGEELDARSDLFSVGVVLHELLTGMHPFEAGTEINLLSNILTGNRRPTRNLLPDAPPALIAVLDALLATERDHRPSSAIEALRAIPLTEPSFVLKRGLEELLSALELPSLRISRPHDELPGHDVQVATQLDGRGRPNGRAKKRTGALLMVVLTLLGGGAAWTMRDKADAYQGSSGPPDLPPQQRGLARELPPEPLAPSPPIAPLANAGPTVEPRVFVPTVETEAHDEPADAGRADAIELPVKQALAHPSGKPAASARPMVFKKKSPSASSEHAGERDDKKESDAGIGRSRVRILADQF